MDWKVENEKFEAMSAGDLVKDGEVISLDDVLEVEPIAEQFKKRTGEEVKTTRFRYVLKDRTVRIPWSAHKQILACQKEGARKVKITVSGSGDTRRYGVVTVVV